MADALYEGWRFRILTMIDEGNREALAIEVGTSIPSSRVIRVLEELIAVHGRPAAFRVDNGPRAARTELRRLVCRPRHCGPLYSARQARSECVHRTFQSQLSDGDSRAYVFESLAEVRALTERWLRSYNHERPHDTSDGSRR
jgi:putative transposase